MARDEKNPAKGESSAEEEAPAPKSGKKRLIIIVAAIVLVLACGGAAAYFLLKGGKDKGHEESDAKEEGRANATVMVPFDDKFTVNLQGEDGALHYLLVPKIELEVGNESVAKQVDERKSKISDRISGVLRSRTLKEMLESGSDVKLKEDLKKVINDTLELKGRDRGKGVQEVILPASFLVQ